MPLMIFWVSVFLIKSSFDLPVELPTYIFFVWKPFLTVSIPFQEPVLVLCPLLGWEDQGCIWF